MQVGHVEYDSSAGVLQPAVHRELAVAAASTMMNNCYIQILSRSSYLLGHCLSVILLKIVV